MYLLRDTFNNRTISKHRLLYDAVKADRAHADGVTTKNGWGSYIPTEIIHVGGLPLDDYEWDEVIQIGYELDTE